jgi:hypothetical protein
MLFKLKIQKQEQLFAALVQISEMDEVLSLESLHLPTSKRPVSEKMLFTV